MSEIIQRELFDENGEVVGYEYRERLVRCKDCKRFRLSTMYKNWGVCLLANDEGYGVCREARIDSFCSWGELKDKVKE